MENRGNRNNYVLGKDASRNPADLFNEILRILNIAQISTREHEMYFRNFGSIEFGINKKS